MSEPQKDGSGKWIYRFELPPDPDTGKRRQKQITARTKQGCYERERAAREQATQQRTHVERIPLNAYLDEWLEQVVRITYPKRSTYRNYATWLRLHVRPHLGDLLLHRITPAHCERWIAALVDAGCEPGSIANYTKALNVAFSHAERTERIAANPLQHVKRPPIPRVQRPVWTPEQALAFLRVAEQDNYHPFWLLAMTTGMRKSELLALRWQDVDLRTGRLRVDRAYYPANGGEDDPKSPSSRRALYLDPHTLAALQEHRIAQDRIKRDLGARYEDHGFICCRLDGRRIVYGMVYPRMRRLCAAAGVPRLSPHGLRRTSATRLLDAGYEIGVVSRRLGHSDTRTTRQFYYTIEEHAERVLADGVHTALFGQEPEDASRREVAG